MKPGGCAVSVLLASALSGCHKQQATVFVDTSWNREWGTLFVLFGTAI
jgi:hypothetical protein